MKQERNLYFKLYPNVIPTRGYNRSTLIDLQTNQIHFVPNGLLDVFSMFDFENETFEKILLSIKDEETRIILNEYLNFILSKDLGLLGDKITVSGMTPLSIKFYPDSKINNVIFEFDENSSWNIKNILDQLNKCGTKFLEIRFLDYSSFERNINDIQNLLFTHTIEFVHILVPFNSNLKKIIDQNLKDFYRMNRLTVYNSNSGFELENKRINIVFTTQESIDKNHCGNVSEEYFSINIPSYINNKNNNSCLAFKLAIDKNGTIKNCPSVNDQFGHSDKTLISEVLLQQDFKKLWSITKDQISICSDCEFRWVCTDCRAFTTSQNNHYAKPSKCTYNPYISLWEDQENYLSEEESGVSIKNSILTIDHKQLKKINKRIWG